MVELIAGVILGELVRVAWRRFWAWWRSPFQLLFDKRREGKQVSYW